jgi:hypothetical protein
MKLSIIVSAIALACVTEAATAACGDPQIMDAALTNLLSGNTVCVSKSGGWENQEEHMAGGALVDFKKGPSDPVDPTKQVGTWSVTGTGTGTMVNYTYSDASGSSGPFSFTVHSANNSNLSFCDASNTEIVAATLKNGTGAGCP